MSWQPKTLGQSLLEKDFSTEALVTQDQRFTYGELKEKAEQAAGSMQALGIGKGDHVAILMPNGEDWLALFYGAALIGAVTVPVNTRFKAAEIDFCLKQSGAKALVYVDRFLNIDFGAMVGETGFSNAIEVSRLRAGKFTPVEVKPDDLLLIQFTSGTTAYPKGAMLTHDNMLRNAWAAGNRIGVRADDRYFNCRPFFHVGGSTLSALMSLVFGCCLVTLPTFEARAALEMLERERCTLISGNDTIFQMLMGHEDFARRRLSLRGGWAAAGPQTMRAIIDRLGMKSVCAAYGLSEASPNVVMSDWRDPEELRVQGLALPLPGLEVRIKEGEIQVRGWSLMRGYVNNPEGTAKAFTPDGWLRTGDLGELTADGRLRMSGRLKDVFRVGGENVAPAEVEEVLLAHPAVETAQVIGVPDARLGEVPCAYVTLKSGFEVTEEDLKSWTKERSANFRVPRYLRIVSDFESIGMTASGKVQKTKLREHALKEFALPMSSRAVVVLSLAGFASSAAQRCTDPLLPLLAQYFGTTAGGASAVITAFAVAYGALQLVNGPIADRVGKFRMIFWVTVISAAGNLACAFAPTLPLLVLARFASGATIGAIAPLAIAWIGDAVPYERRQPVLARFLIGVMLGGALATVVSGALGEHYGWRSVFFALSGLYVVVAILLWREMRTNPATQHVVRGNRTLLQSFPAMFGLLRNPWVRIVLATVAVEGALSTGGLAFAAFHAHDALGLSVTLSGALVAFAALGGLLYAALAGRLVPRLGERGLVIGGGLLLCVGLPGFAAAPGPLWAIPCLMAQGMGLMMMHNTLQVHGTQMAPDSRGAAMALFAFSLFTGQSVGVWLASLMVDTRGTVPVFLAAGAGLVLLAYFFQRQLRLRLLVREVKPVN